jgi:CBS domain containing-hemolysin-like protein
MEDIVETLLGFEIVDEKDKIADLQQYARERWKKRKQKYDLLENREDKEGRQENPAEL